MRLNSLKPGNGARQQAVRVGRGMGSGLGKTCGCGHKGAKARSGYSRNPGFEGGQLPLQRRLPKFGFRSQLAKSRGMVRLRDLDRMAAERIDIAELRKANLIAHGIKQVKVIATGEIKRAITLVGIRATTGAKQAIVAAGGQVVAH